MRFAIFGDHPDGWRMAEALRASGRHQVAAYAGAELDENRRLDWPGLRVTKDIEELLSDPNIEAVVVASPSPLRLDHLRRVLQSERPALCVHPVDSRPDGGYEIHMLQGDVHQVALPILPEAFAGALETLKLKLDSGAVVRLEVQSTEAALFESGQHESRPSFPGWTLLRHLGGEIIEIAALAANEDARAIEPVVAFGKFQNARLLQASWLSAQPQTRWQVALYGGQVEPAEISVNDPASWAAIVARFEQAAERLKSSPRAAPGSGPPIDLRDGLGWNDEIRALELNDLARRSIERRRAYSLDFQEATEEVGFKGTMTLIGCALLWLVPVVLLLSAWIPWLGWLVVPVLLAFLALQLLKGSASGEGK
jgi:predicted dehydrogenase